MIENNVFIKGCIGMFLFLQNADGQTCVEHVALFGNMMGQGMVGLIGLVLIGLLVVAPLADFRRSQCCGARASHDGTRHDLAPAHPSVPGLLEFPGPS